MRILMLNWRDPFNPSAGGAERVTLKHMAAMEDRGHDVTWFSHRFAREPLLEYDGPPLWSSALDRIGGIRIIRGRGGIRSIREAMNLEKISTFDLVIDQHHGIPWYAPWWCKGRCVSYIHEILGRIWDDFYKPPLNWIGRLQERITLRIYARQTPFWCPSASTEKKLRALGVKNVMHIPNGCDVKPIQMLPHKFPVDEIKLVTVSRLAPNKRIEDAIISTALLQRSGRKASLQVVGSGREEDYLRQIARAMKANVTFAGQITDDHKNELLSKAHFLLNPSVNEGWGLNVIEANSLGTPAIGYPSCGLVDSIKSGITGEISKTQTPSSMRDSIIEGCKNYDKIRIGAWEWSKQFQWDAILPRICHWLEQF